MTSSSKFPIDIAPGPDLHPIYPCPSTLAPLLEPYSGLDPTQKGALVTHSLCRACLFGDLSLLSFLLSDPQAQAFVDLGICDEDGLGLVSLTIFGFGPESDRDVEREECVRLLVSEGADVNHQDNAGWTALHHAALMSPPTLVSFLLTHGCSPFSQTQRGPTPLDIVTAHSTMPGRQDVALLLGEAMRGEGWTGGRMEEQRRQLERRTARKRRRERVREDVGKVLTIAPQWWGDDEWEATASESDEDESEDEETVLTPSFHYTSMLVFSPPALPQIFQSLIINFTPSMRNSEPANVLYMLARFACLTCDSSWLEDLIIGATDAIEETFFSRSEDLPCLVFWLHNTTVWLHLMRCDNSINEACELLGSFILIEEVINSVFVFVIRYVERRTDRLLDPAILEYSSPSELDGIQFESEWSFFRSLTPKKKGTPNQTAAQTPKNGNIGSLSIPTRPTTPDPSSPPSSRRGFASLKQSLSRTRGDSSNVPLQSMFNDAQPPKPNPNSITSMFDALQTFLVLSGTNPALITQMWSQVFYWMACELFNRVLSRKKILCRSRALQVGMNLSVLEEWIEAANLPRGILSHLAPVRDLLNWLQCLSSIAEFSNLVVTIQTLKHLNPLQMRRAVKDYKYEVNEGHMTEECSQYLLQLQKDWERHRVKLGVEALRKEMEERERDDSSSIFNDNVSARALSSAGSVSTESSTTQHNIDILFDREQDAASWEPARPPEVLGEFLDSRYMLPLLLPSDPVMLSATPTMPAFWRNEDAANGITDSRCASRASKRSAGSMPWRITTKTLRDTSLDILQWVDGAGSHARWARQVDMEGREEEEYDGEEPPRYNVGSGDDPESASTSGVPRATPLTRKPSVRTKGRASTPVERTP
ncbi:DIL domain-containing protein [Russula dissimulans]|nr:DIL domain-containing protein [Russula dissimulans]